MSEKYQLKKNENGGVYYLMRTGKDVVKSQMSFASAQKIVKGGKRTETINTDYPIGIDNQWFFEGEEVEDKKFNDFSRRPYKK